MGPEVNLLIVSDRLENTRTLLDTIEGLPVKARTIGTLGQAWKALLEKPVDIILCDEILPDGSYRDFLCAVRSEYKLTRFVVLSGSDLWDDYLEAIRLGACDVVCCPYHETDIYLAIMHASRGAACA